jgi:hypothetical protein
VFNNPNQTSHAAAASRCSASGWRCADAHCDGGRHPGLFSAFGVVAVRRMFGGAYPMRTAPGLRWSPMASSISRPTS